MDDGTREKAWDFKIGSEPYRKLTPGTFVHARVNMRSRADVTVEPGCFRSWRAGSVSCAGGLILINIDDRLIRSSIWDHANDPLS